MARHIPLPAFLSTKRSSVSTVAIAGTLTLAAAVSAAAVTLPATFPASASVRAAGLNLDLASHPVTSLREAAVSDLMQSDLAAAKAAAAKAAAAARKAAGQAAARRHAASAAAARKAAEQAADAAAARQAAADQAAQQAPATEPSQPAQQAAVTVTAGSAQQVAEQMLSQFGWSPSQFGCLDPLWAQESGWRVTAENPGSGAYGIPQALPGSKMASAGADWETDAATQIRWGLTYIKSLYGSPCGAWAHEEANGWY